MDSLKYQAPIAERKFPSGELLTIKLRYNIPEGTNGHKMTIPFADSGVVSAENLVSGYPFSVLR